MLAHRMHAQVPFRLYVSHESQLKRNFTNNSRPTLLTGDFKTLSGHAWPPDERQLALRSTTSNPSIGQCSQQRVARFRCRLRFRQNTHEYLGEVIQAAKREQRHVLTAAVDPTCMGQNGMGSPNSRRDRFASHVHSSKQTVINAMFNKHPTRCWTHQKWSTEAERQVNF